MQDSRTNGAHQSVEVAASPEGQGGVAELGLRAGGRVVPALPDPELVERAKRRSFTAEYKAKIVAQAEAMAGKPGAVGELLRREGLYSSHLTEWRKQRDAGALAGLSKPRGRPPVDKRDAEIAALKRRAERAEAEVSKLKRVVEIQGNLSALLQELGTGSADGSTER